MYTQNDMILELMKTQLNKQYSEQEIPNTTYLIWFGKEIPEGKDNDSQDYLRNIFDHKKKNPTTTVKLIVSKKILNDWDTLATRCLIAGVELINFDANFKDHINRDIVEKFLENERDYVCASDVLRLSLL
jgi:hypothetical protein